jgi:hypothetical protein
MLSSPEESVHRRLHHELEQAIAAINREQIGAITGAVSRAGFTSVARMVANLRARYLRTVLELAAGPADACIPTEAALELKRLREAYTEAMEGFAALEHAVQRGYLALTE